MSQPTGLGPRDTRLKAKMFMWKSLVSSRLCAVSICLCPEGTTEIRRQTTREQLIHTRFTFCLYGYSDDDSALLAPGESPHPQRKVVRQNKGGKTANTLWWKERRFSSLMSCFRNYQWSLSIYTLFGLVGKVRNGVFLQEIKLHYQTIRYCIVCICILTMTFS